MTSRLLSWLCLAFLTVVLAAILLPAIYAMAFAPRVAPTHLFYSAVKQDFVYREHRGNHDFTYATASGEHFDRKAFEMSLPFIYYKNMELWGLLPIEIDGQSFDMQAIRDARQVFELKAREVADRHPSVPVHALLDSDPGKAGLSFPEDVFRMKPDRMEFLDVDENRVDPALTDRFTEALAAERFAFPARLVAGKQTILKPFDEGVFLVDAEGAVFHVKRVGDDPVIVRTPIPTDLGIRSIKVQENRQRIYLGLVLTVDNRLFLLQSDGYGLVELPSSGYDADRMDYKLLLNPVHPTAVFGDGGTVTAVALNEDLLPIAAYSRAVPGTTGMIHARISKLLFPVTLSLGTGNSGYLGWTVSGPAPLAFLGNLLAVGVVLLFGRRRRIAPQQMIPQLALAAIAGLYGVLAIALLPGPGPATGATGG